MSAALPYWPTVRAPPVVGDVCVETGESESGVAAIDNFSCVAPASMAAPIRRTIEFSRITSRLDAGDLTLLNGPAVAPRCPERWHRSS